MIVGTISNRPNQAVHATQPWAAGKGEIPEYAARCNSSRLIISAWPIEAERGSMIVTCTDCRKALGYERR